MFIYMFMFIIVNIRLDGKIWPFTKFWQILKYVYFFVFFLITVYGGFVTMLHTFTNIIFTYFLYYFSVHLKWAQCMWTLHIYSYKHVDRARVLYTNLVTLITEDTWVFVKEWIPYSARKFGGIVYGIWRKPGHPASHMSYICALVATRGKTDI